MTSCGFPGTSKDWLGRIVILLLEPGETELGEVTREADFGTGGGTSLELQKLAGLFAATPVVIQIDQSTQVDRQRGVCGRVLHPADLVKALKVMLLGFLATAHEGQAEAPLVLDVDGVLVFRTERLSSDLPELMIRAARPRPACPGS